MALADTFDEIVGSLPDDWTDLELDLRIFDEQRYIEAATYLVQTNAQPYSHHDWHWRILVAHRFGHAASAPATLGALRGVWAAVGLRGPRAHVAHTALRLATDQTIENATGVGAPPRTWPVDEQVVDVLHKAIYSLVTGLVSERLVAPELEARRGTRSH